MLPKQRKGDRKASMVVGRVELQLRRDPDMGFGKMAKGPHLWHVWLS